MKYLLLILLIGCQQTNKDPTIGLTPTELDHFSKLVGEEKIIMESCLKGIGHSNYPYCLKYDLTDFRRKVAGVVEQKESDGIGVGGVILGTAIGTALGK